MVEKPKRRGIYRIEVYEKESGRKMQTGYVQVGQWPEIGYWLDNLGYIENEYEIRITVEIPL